MELIFEIGGQQCKLCGTPTEIRELITGGEVVPVTQRPHVVTKKPKVQAEEPRRARTRRALEPPLARDRSRHRAACQRAWGLTGYFGWRCSLSVIKGALRDRARAMISGSLGASFPGLIVRETRQTQNLLPARACWFESGRGHHLQG